ncbi:hypothetical protein HYT53_00060 [Candidatus Woesearchaeota archaeon]|nr:hypothetical protein [Candidatus Woesearchaeota archaeon]
MLKMRKLFLLFLILLFFEIPFAHAHCPLCTAAVGAAAISAKYYGLDTSIIGLLVGAFGISTGLWIGLKIKKEYFKFQFSAIVLASFLLTIVPLLSISSDSIYLPLLIFGSSGSLLNKVYWVDKMLLGSIIGGVTALLAFFIHSYIKKAKGKVLFPFQGVAITLLFLSASSLILYVIFG